MHASSVISELKVKKQDYHYDLLEWPKSKTLVTPNASENGKQELISLLVGMQDGTVTLKDNLAVPDKTKHTLTI